MVIDRHPKQTADRIDEFGETLHEILHKINMKSQTFYVVGDFNVDLQKIDCGNYVRKYANHLLSSDCKCGIDVPTRITDAANSLLDHIYK